MAMEVLDQASGVIAPVFKTSAQEWTDAFGPELAAMVYEVPGGLFLSNVGRVVAGVLLGIGALAATMIASGRDKEALMHMGAHWLTHPNAPGLWGIAAAGAATGQSLAGDLNALKTGIAGNNFDLIRGAFVFSPADVDSYFKSLNAQFQSLFAGSPLAAVAAAAQAQAPPATESIVAQVQAAVGYGEVF